MNWMSGGPAGFSPWILSGDFVYYDGAVIVHDVSGGSKGPGSLNVRALYIQGQQVLPNAYLPLIGGTLTGNLFINNPLYASVSLNKVGSPNQYTSVIGNYNNKHRWFLNIGNNSHDPDDGSNQGSDFDLNNYGDNGVILGTPLSIARATGAATFSGDVKVLGAFNPNSLTIADASLFVLGGGLPGDFLQTDGSGNVSWVPAPAGGGGDGGGGAGYLPLSGGVIAGPLAIATTGSVDFILDKNASGNVNAIWGKTNEVDRWCIEVGSASAESGTNNSGSAFNIKNYNDAGSNIGTPFSINRTDGKITITNLFLNNITNVSIGGGTSGSILSTNGSGVLSWIPAGSVGIPEAPTVTGAVYGRGQGIWTQVLPLSGGAIAGSLVVGFNITCSGTMFPSTLTMNNGNFINFIDNSGGSTSGFLLNASNMFSFTLSNSTGAAQNIFTCQSHITNPVFTFGVPVYLPAGDPSNPLQAASKGYVDSKFGDIDAGGY